jgi:hypothetical protein
LYLLEEIKATANITIYGFGSTLLKSYDGGKKLSQDWISLADWMEKKYNGLINDPAVLQSYYNSENAADSMGNRLPYFCHKIRDNKLFDHLSKESVAYRYFVLSDTMSFDSHQVKMLRLLTILLQKKLPEPKTDTSIISLSEQFTKQYSFIEYLGHQVANISPEHLIQYLRDCDKHEKAKIEKEKEN